MMGLAAEIAADAFLEVAGLADIENRAGLIEHAVHAGFVCQRFEEALGIETLFHISFISGDCDRWSVSQQRFRPPEHGREHRRRQAPCLRVVPAAMIRID